jgi:PKD domain-containing protein
VATKFLAAAVVALTAVVLVPGAGAANMTAVGAAAPSTVAPGGSTLLTVAVTPAEGQSGEGIGVVCNLAPIGGGMTLFHDDGTNGDVTAGDLTFSDAVIIPAATPDGTIDIFCVANDPGQVPAETDIFINVTSAEPVNQPPSVDAGGPYTVAEGGSVTLSATGSDPEGGPLTYAWDLDNNGTFETPGQAVSFSAGDGPDTATVHVQVTDDGGLTAVGDATVTITNVPPTATFGAPTSADAGIPFMLSLSGASDPSAADTTAGFTYAFDCGDGYGSFGTDASQLCPTTDVGTLSVGAEIRDKDGDITEYRGSIDVVVTFDGLCDLVHAYTTDAKLVAGLCNKLDAAANAPTPTAKAGDLGAFRNMVDAKVGKGLTSDQAAELELLSTRL